MDSRVYNLLVVFSLFPEELYFIRLLGLAKGEFQRVLRFHHNYINGVDEPLSSEILNFFYGSDGELRFVQENNPVIAEDFDAIIITGLIL